MRWMCAQLRTFLLLAVALTVAAHPIARSLPPSHVLVSELGLDAQVVICTSHGPVALDEPAGTPQPVTKDAPCPWCAIKGELAGKLVAIAAVQIGTLDPPQLLPRDYAAVHFVSRPTPADWPAHAPRGPPSLIGA